MRDNYQCLDCSEFFPEVEGDYCELCGGRLMPTDLLSFVDEDDDDYDY